MEIISELNGAFCHKPEAYAEVIGFF